MLTPLQDATTISPEHEKEFVKRYSLLLSWCLRLTKHREKAEDLLHDAFLHFTQTRPDLTYIKNLEAFLRTLVRNLYISRDWRVSIREGQKVYLEDFPSSETTFQSPSGREPALDQDEIACISSYALARKGSSKAASALILRFFHGYYPSEIAQVMKCSRGAVYELLRRARSEARRRDGHDSVHANLLEKNVLQSDHRACAREFIENLRLAMLQPPNGHCPPREALQALYGDSKCIPSPVLAHLVDCGGCLDQVNSLLNLRPLCLRDPIESLGYDRNPKNKSAADNLSDSSSSDTLLDAPGMQVTKGPEPQQEQLLQTVRHGLAMLPQTDKDVVELFYFEGVTLRGIAARNGESVATVQDRFYRTLIKLRYFIRENSNKELP